MKILNALVMVIESRNKVITLFIGSAITAGFGITGYLLTKNFFDSNLEFLFSLTLATLILNFQILYFSLEYINIHFDITNNCIRVSDISVRLSHKGETTEIPIKLKNISDRFSGEFKYELAIKCGDEIISQSNNINAINMKAMSELHLTKFYLQEIQSTKTWKLISPIFSNSPIELSDNPFPIELDVRISPTKGTSYTTQKFLRKGFLGSIRLAD